MTITTFQIATLAGALTDLGELATPVIEPRSTYQPYAVSHDLGNGMVRGSGYPVATWTWDFISAAERTMLRTYCTGRSSRVQIATKDDSLAYKAYTAVMVWPEIEEHFAGRRLNFTIEFHTLVEIGA
ncbi:MAG TPA: hypothetical protein VLH56_05260 [Dissulfurispiraceae bacterium]|nr:hypothetical protein [Dissulfurispiraceae bacterium]